MGSNETVRVALEPYKEYLDLYDRVKVLYDEETDRANMTDMKSIEDLLYKENVCLYEMSFEQQFHFGMIYAWVKLKEQEIRNVRWISNMITLNMAKDQGYAQILPIFDPTSKWR